MQTGKNTSWKEKIDPAFDKPMRKYREFLELLERIPNNGQLVFKDEFKELVNKNYDCLEHHKLEFNHEMLKFVKTVGFTDDDASSILLYLNSPEKDHNKFFKTYLNLVEKLPEKESKQFYRNTFQIFLDDPAIKPSFKDNKDFLSVAHSLLIRNLFMNIDVIIKKEATREELEQFKNPMVLNSVVGLIYSMLAQIAHQSTLQQLISNNR